MTALLLATPASANSATGLKGLADAAALAIGIAALALSAVLGTLSWVTVLRPPSGVGGIFGRGFLGVSAVIAFAIGGLGVALGLELWFARTPGWVLVLLGVLVMAFLAIEFLIAATLYRRSGARRPSVLAKLLAAASYALAALSVLGAGLVVLVGLISALDDGPSSQVRRYQTGCEAGDGSDCNMLGLRYQTGDPGLPKNPTRAATAFRKSCDLGTATGCKNLAALYRSGDGVPIDLELAEKYERRYEALAFRPAQ